MNSLIDQASRRNFIRRACCAAVGTTSMLSAMAQLRVIGAVAADSRTRFRAAAIPADYKALVCLFLNGGNDATNMVVPFDETSYQSYASARGSLALPRSMLLPLALKRYSDGRSYGLHASMPEVANLFGQGRLAVLANVGTLVRPTTLGDYKADRGVPPKLFSHSDQVMHWQSSLPDQPYTTGWGGRLGDMLDAMNSNHDISMAISLSGDNSFQRGKSVFPYSVNPTGVSRMSSGATSNSNVGLRTAAIRKILEGPQSNLLAAAFGGVSTEAIKDSEVLTSTLDAAPVLRTIFPSTFTGSRLAMIAKLISVAPSLGLKRQIFFLQLFGWDLHGGQAEGHGPLLAEISAAMNAFYSATLELGVANQVTTFTASDFGRTYIPNAGGTDHGWGSHQLVMGGAVQGGDIYGRMPSLVVNGPDDTGRGRWIPSTSVDEYNATLASWFGVSLANLPVVLPNIDRFPKPNLGFMI